MNYIYIEKGRLLVSNKKPSTQYIALNKMPPIMYNKQCEPILKADFEQNKVWYEYKEIPKTEEEIKKDKEHEIKSELVELDKTINRATEDLYILTNSTPYASVAEVINKKNKLRQELQELKEVL